MHTLPRTFHKWTTWLRVKKANHTLVPWAGFSQKPYFPVIRVPHHLQRPWTEMIEEATRTKADRVEPRYNVDCCKREEELDCR